MSTTYVFCKKIIANKTYGTKEDLLVKMDVFLMNNRITEAEYEELVALLG